MTYRVSSRVWMVLGVGALIIVCIPLLLGWLIWQQARDADASYNLVEHTHEVLATVDELRNIAREAESAQRAYMLTKSLPFAAEYGRHRGDAPKALDRLAKLVKDNPDQSARVAPLRTILEQRLHLLDENAKNADSIASEALTSRLANSAEKSAQLNGQLEKFKGAELELLEQRRARFVEQRLELQRVAIATSLVGLIALIGGAFVLYRESRNRMLYENKLSEARDAALDSVKTTSAFVASVSHEIRTPMNGVLGAADLLLRDSTLSHKQRDGVETIRSSGKALLAIINDILDLSKLQAGEMKFVKEGFSPSNVVEEVLTLFAEPAARKGLELASHLAADLPEQVMGDRLRLRQVLLNLVSNAVKFTERGGVTIHVVRRQQMESEGRICLRIDVSDTGPGISKDAQDRLFQPFAQVDTKLAQRHGGTGLGLAVSRELVQRMNGTLNVESSLGRGATFWFTVVFEAAAGKSASRNLEASTIVIVESRPMTAESVRAHAAAWGLNPVVAGHSRELADKLDPQIQGNDAHLGAVVVGVPQGESWHDTVRALRQRAWMGQTPVYVMPDGDDVTDELMQRIGVAGLLKYPFRPSELYDHLSGTHEPREIELPERLELPPSKILIADDNPVNQRVLTNQLDYLGMHVTVCSDGSEALAMTKDGDFDLVLMDCQMPVMDGFEATRLIRARERGQPGRHIPIIAVTAHVMSGDAELCLEAGMDGYLAKPVEVERLQQALFRWLPKGLATPSRPATAATSPGAKSPATTPAPAAEPGVDEAQLKGCLTGEPELDADLVRMAAAQVIEVIERMEAALQTGDNNAWRQAAHLGRGSSSTMGFKHAATLFSTAEFEATSKDARAQILTKLREAHGNLVSTLQALGYLPALETAPA